MENLYDPDEALRIVMDFIPDIGTESVHLNRSLGRVIAEDAIAEQNLPPFDNSAMDGYAVIAEDIQHASGESPKTLNVIACQAAGMLTPKIVTPGTAIRIMTGAAIPRGADSVVMVENTALENENIKIFQEVRPGENVRFAGEDIRRGDTVIFGGTRIGPAQMGILAALGKVNLKVYAKPKVAIVTTGSEIVDVSQNPAPGQIRDSNQYSLLGQVLSAGAEVSMLSRVSDEINMLRDVLEQAADVSDVVITSGGVSVGDYDFVKETLFDLGEVRFWRVAIKPGKPLVYGSIKGRPLFGLPGNPVSSMVTFDVFVRPLLERMSGVRDPLRCIVSGCVSENVKHKIGRREYIRCNVKWNGSGYVATPTGDQGSAMLSSMLDANAYIIISQHSGSLKAGDHVDILMMNEA